MIFRAFRNVVPQILLHSSKGRFRPLAHCTVSRSICDRALLKLDNYDKEKQRFAARISDMDSFWLRILSLNTVFEEDLKQAWVLAEESELPTVIELSEKYFKEESLFTTFKFGPLMMRSCHYLKQPDLAMQIFRNPCFTKLMDDAMSIIILMDLLIESGKFEEACSVYDYLCEAEWYFVLRHPLVPMLYIISLYKQGTKEAFLKAQERCKKLYISPNYRAKVETIVAGFALKINEPLTAINLMHRKAIESELAFNIKLQGLLRRLEWDKLMKDIGYMKHHNLYEDTMQLIINAGMEKLDTSNLKYLKTTVEEKLLSPLTLEENKSAMKSTIKKKFYS